MRLRINGQAVEYLPLSQVDSDIATERGVDIAQTEAALDEKDHGTTPFAPIQQDIGNKILEDGGDNDTAVHDHELPTDEEKVTLRRVADNIPLAAFTIVIVELCERFAFYGLSGVFQNYISNPLPPGGNGAGAPASPNDPAPAGALNQGQTTATGLNNMFSFLAYIFPIMGAIIADSKWGRYKTVAVFCVVYFFGLLIITLTSIPSSLRSGGGLPGWIVGAIIVAAGTGGIKANVSPLVADQYRAQVPFIRTLSSGERVIVDPNVTITRIYNLFYWCINVGSLSAIATTELERRVGFWAAYLLPTSVFLLTPIVLIAGSGLYRRVPPRGSIIVEVWRVAKLALSGFWMHPMRYIREARQTGVWDRARPSYQAESGDIAGTKSTSWNITWDDTFVSEVQRTAKACQIFLFYPLYWISYNQITTNLISMAATMSTHGVPNDLLQNFDPIALIILIPIMDVLVYPGLRRVGFIARPIWRIWLGFMFGAAAMVYSAVLQHFIYKTNPCGDFVGECATPSSINVWVQVPSYVLIAISEIFASITGLEYAYNKAPARMKSVVMSVFLFMTAIGNAINAALSPVAEDPKLVGNYTGIAIATFIAGNVFYLFFHKRDRYEEDENAIGKGRSQDSGTSLDEFETSPGPNP